MLIETHVDVILFRECLVKDENGEPVFENGRPKIKTQVMLFDTGEGLMLPGGPIPEIPPEECDGCDPFDDNAPAELLAMNLVEHLTGLGPEYIEDGAYHQYKWKNVTQYYDEAGRLLRPPKGKAVLYYYAFVREETDAERALVDGILAEHQDAKFFSEEDLNGHDFPWAGGSLDEVTIREIFDLFKPHIEQ